jgi:hypothetical protein
MDTGTGMPHRHNTLMKCFMCLPQKILSLHGIDNMAEFVLHDLCDESCFNLSKAAYFVDNPDFDCLKGIAGYDRTEETMTMEDRWKNPHQFTNHAAHCAFNQKVRGIAKTSSGRQKQDDKSVVNDLSHELSMKNPRYISWDIKHQNHAIFIFESMPNDILELDDDMLKGMCLLGFCPIC